MHYGDDKDATSRDNPAADKETARLVELCADQIAAAVDEASGEIDALSRSVLDTARRVSDLVGAVSEQGTGRSPAEASVLADCQALRQAVQDAGMHLQFADRLSQRLSNVSKNLVGLAELMQSTDQPIAENRWSAFLAEMRATFTMEQERQMFDARFGAEVTTNTAPGIVLFDKEATDGE